MQLTKAQSVLYFKLNFDKGRLTHCSFNQIEKDIDRTYPTEPEFAVDQNKVIFKEALQELALHFPKLGYIQGINFIVGFFILCDMTKTEAIKMFIAMTLHPKLMLYGLY